MEVNTFSQQCVNSNFIYVYASFIPLAPGIALRSCLNEINKIIPSCHQNINLNTKGINGYGTVHYMHTIAHIILFDNIAEIVRQLID